MRIIRREELIEPGDMILYDILEEIKKLNSYLEPNKKPVNVVREETKMYSCKYCGGSHEKTWQIANCAREYKKKG